MVTKKPDGKPDRAVSRAKSNQNLKPFQKGCAPGPGRKPYKHVEEQFQAFLNEVIKTKAGDKTRLELIMNGLTVVAAKGDSKAANTLLDRAFGKPKQQIALTDADDGPLTFIVKGLD